MFIPSNVPTLITNLYRIARSFSSAGYGNLSLITAMPRIKEYIIHDFTLIYSGIPFAEAANRARRCVAWEEEDEK